MVSRHDQTFIKLHWFRSGDPLFFIYLLISLRHCQTLQHTNLTNYNQGMLSGSVQKMSRERLREKKKGWHLRHAQVNRPKYSIWPKVLQHVKISLYNQPKPYFFKKLLWSHFWIDFNKFYTKTFRIVYILIVYLLIMFIWVVFICS
jgi:hypothetical protein